jgi:hypothetical protein
VCLKHGRSVFVNHSATLQYHLNPARCLVIQRPGPVSGWNPTTLESQLPVQRLVSTSQILIFTRLSQRNIPK